MGQGGFPAAGQAGKPEKGASAVEAVAVRLLDAAALQGEDSR